MPNSWSRTRTHFLAGVLTLLVLFARPVDADPAPLIRGPVTRVLIVKSAHALILFAGETELKSYQVAIGPGGPGFKQHEGDNVTPVGRYRVTMHQPSRFKTFLRIDYPQKTDWMRFATLKKEGKIPKEATIGGDIGIHGTGNPEWNGVHKRSDWTAGCIAVDDDEIVEIARLVKDGTVVDIED